jgi:spermidine synthase
MPNEVKFQSVSNILSGRRVLEEVVSPINGKLTVVRDLAWGTYIQGGGLTQSGGVVYKVWEKTLKEIKKLRNEEIRKCLILGLGGGSAAKLVRKYWPEAVIVGVEIDPIFVALGKKYLRLDEIGVDIKIRDAYEYITQISKLKSQNLDLILVDMYIEDEVPKKFESKEFIKIVKSLLEKNGLVVFNRLYYDEKRKQAEDFHKKLSQAFKKVRPVYPEANVMYVCSNK